MNSALAWKSTVRFVLNSTYLKVSPHASISPYGTSTSDVATNCDYFLHPQRRCFSYLHSSPPISPTATPLLPSTTKLNLQIQRRYLHKIHKSSVRITLIGPPGSGKGTQSAKIERDFGLSTISTGQILRQLADEKTEKGASVSAILKAGGLVSDDIMLDIIKNAIQKEKNGWLLDGYPRNPKQAAQLDELLHDIMQPLSLVFYLDVPESVLLERIQERWVHPASGRTYNMTFSPPKVHGKDDATGEPLVRRMDDNAVALQTRIQTYHDATLPLIEYYRTAGILVPVESPTSTIGYVKIKEVLQNMVEM